MLVEDAIRGRASIKVFSSDPIDPDVIVRCLDAAVWAPNHHLTEPWFFTVISEAGREALADLAETIWMSRAGDQGDVAKAKALKERAKLLSAPGIIAVYSAVGAHERETRENFAASAAAAQNVLLMVHREGLAGIWRTGPLYDEPDVRNLLHVPADAWFVGVLFIGHSGQREVKRRRTPASMKTYWLLEDPRV